MISNLPTQPSLRLPSILTFRRIPRAPEESARSLPARSTKLILLTWGWKKKKQVVAGVGRGKEGELGE